MNAEERALIDGLFDRMRSVADTPRDREAEALIAQRVAQAPYAPYALTQTVLVQEHALQAASARIEELEAAARERPQPEDPGAGSFLGGLFGGGAGRGTSVPTAGQRPAGYEYSGREPAPQMQPQAGMPTRGGPMMGAGGALGGGGGGFLQSALSTAAGVAGGALLFDGIKSMMGGSASPFGAAKAEAPAADKTAAASTDTASTSTASADSGSSWNPWGAAKDDKKDDAKDASAADPKEDAKDTSQDASADAASTDTASADDADTFPYADDYAADDSDFDTGSDDSGWA